MVQRVSFAVTGCSGTEARSSGLLVPETRTIFGCLAELARCHRNCRSATFALIAESTCCTTTTALVALVWRAGRTSVAPSRTHARPSGSRVEAVLVVRVARRFWPAVISNPFSNRGEIPARPLTNSDGAIGDIEALLIQKLGDVPTGKRSTDALRCFCPLGSAAE